MPSYTPEVEAQIVSALRAGTSCAQIARDMAISPSGVQGVARRHGIRLETGRPRGVTSTEADRLRAKARQMDKDGKTTAQIAHALRRSQRAVRGYLTDEDKE